MWYNTVFSWCLSLIAINFNWSTQPWSISQWKSLPWNFRNHFWHVQSITAPSLYTAQTFSCISVVFTFPAIIKHNGWKCCFFFPYVLSIKMATPKLTNLLSFFLCTLIGQLSQYNPTIVLNEVRQLSATRVNLQKNWTKVLANPREWSVSGWFCPYCMFQCIKWCECI